MFERKFHFKGVFLRFFEPKNGEPSLSIYRGPFEGGELPLVDVSIDGRAPKLKILRQAEFVSGALNTYLKDECGNEFVHKLCFDQKTEVFSVSVRYENRSKEVRTLERLSSFALSFSPLKRVYRVFCAPNLTCVFKEESKDELLLSFGRTEFWGNLGSLPSERFYPFCAVENEDGVLAVQMEAPFSWQMELKENSLCGGLAGGIFGHWSREIKPGESFETRRAFFTLQPNLYKAQGALLRALDRSELSMSPMYDDLGTTLGSPVKVGKILKILNELSIKDFLIRAQGAHFHEGVEKLKKAGLSPSVGIELLCDRELEDCLLNFGAPIEEDGRRFFDFSLPGAREIVQNRLIERKREGIDSFFLLHSGNFGYGCDGKRSKGENGRAQAEAEIKLFELLKDKIEFGSISSLEPLRMQKGAFCLLSAFETLPIEAANLQRFVPAPLLRVRAVVKKEDPKEKIIYSLCAAMMGRLCLSDLSLCSEEQLRILREGVAFYKNVGQIIRYGESMALRQSEGMQVLLKEFKNMRLLLVHFFKEENLKVDLEGYRVRERFTDLVFHVKSGALRIAGAPYHAGAFWLEKEEETT